jgi:hypothetical protein
MSKSPWFLVELILISFALLGIASSLTSALNFEEVADRPGKANRSGITLFIDSLHNTECLQSLGFREHESRYNEIQVAKNTCTWLLNESRYQKWLGIPRGLLWIKGNPGTGKSVLMKFAVQTMTSTQTQIIVPFFIHGRGTELQRTPLGLFRGLLNCLLEAFPSHLAELTNLFEDREKRKGSYKENRWSWTENELQSSLSRILSNEMNVSLVLFIDALDELGEVSARRLLRYFIEIMENVKRETAHVKICFSSGHYPILGHHTIPTICVDERNTEDIRWLVSNQLREIGKEADHEQLVTEILSKAQGTFQWAVLMCDRMIKESIICDNPEYLRSIITATPHALHELYANILADVGGNDRQQMIKLFQWVLFAERPLSAHELREALSTDPSMERAAQLRAQRSWSNDLARFETYVCHISRGLVEFQIRDIWEQYDDPNQ